MDENDHLSEAGEVFDRVEGGVEPDGPSQGRRVRQVFLIGLPVLLLSAVFLFLSGKWGSEFRSRVVPDLTAQNPAGEAAAPAMPPQEIEVLRDRVSNTIRRDLTEKLKATRILDVKIESLDANGDGSMDLVFTASYQEADPGGQEATRAVTSKLRLEKKGDEWHVTSISPQDSALIFEDEELIQSARKAKK
jgi:hypothetical protein